jgi:hypothetical protein
MGIAPGLGHNNGPTIEPGHAWRTHVWTKARADLLPTLPIEVVRMRVRRAAELGLPYKTYASVRAQTGHDVIGFLFSSNALRLKQGAGLPDDRAEVLASLVAVDRCAVVHRPNVSAEVAALPQIDAAFPAPLFTQSWSVMRDHVRAIVRARGKPADRYLLVGETPFEREWVDAARLAGFITGATMFDKVAG